MTLTDQIERHRTALLGLVAMLMAGARFEVGKPAVLSRMLRATLLYSLRPVEAATRRLVVLRAHLLTKAGFVVRARAVGRPPSAPIPRGDGPRLPAFSLFDPKLRIGADGRLRYAKHMPRLSFFDGTDPVVEAQPEARKADADERLDATALHARLLGVTAVLEGLPKQARRLLRVQARRETTGQKRRAPLRRGRPPGSRRRGRLEVDRILRDCQQLAFEAIDAPDTS